jgi:hypothetical protein
VPLVVGHRRRDHLARRVEGDVPRGVEHRHVAAERRRHREVQVARALRIERLGERYRQAFRRGDEGRPRVDRGRYRSVGLRDARAGGAGVAQQRLIDVEVERHQRGSHHERVSRHRVGERLAVRDPLQRRAREHLLGCIEDSGVLAVVDDALIDEVVVADLRLLESLLEEAEELVLRVRRHEPGVDHGAKGLGVLLDGGNLFLGGRLADEEILDLGDVDPRGDRLVRELFDASAGGDVAAADAARFGRPIGPDLPDACACGERDDRGQAQEPPHPPCRSLSMLDWLCSGQVE